ncbi:MAG: dimethyl sulfoxide reductase anchor subunit [Coriobacteriales bacterium]|nr:dimethyl sulfoxide reductase anchor subunit [Coriobacteriales bacterium]
MELQWPLIVFTTFICLSAGTFGSIAVVSLREDYRQIQLPGLIVAFAALIIGGGASVLHLQNPARYFGQFGNISSGINQEIIMMALVGIMMVVYFVQLRRRGDAGKMIKAISVVLSLVLVAVVGHSYMMASIPTWNTILLPIYYLINAILLGVLITALILVMGKSDATQGSRLVTVALLALGAFALITLAYVFYIATLPGTVYTEVLHSDITTVPPVDPSTIGTRLLSGDLAFALWGAVVVLGLVLPMIILFVAKKAAEVGTPRLMRGSTAASIALVVVGCLAFRALLYFAGASVFIY